MSTTVETLHTTSTVSSVAHTANNREGDWNGYLLQIDDRRNGSDLHKSPAELLFHKRQSALAYLGKRAQLYGGVCSKNTPRILTPDAIRELGEANRVKRYTRYPWIETLLKLLAEIELIQDANANSFNVISLVHHSK